MTSKIKLPIENGIGEPFIEGRGGVGMGISLDKPILTEKEKKMVKELQDKLDKQTQKRVEMLINKGRK